MGGESLLEGYLVDVVQPPGAPPTRLALDFGTGVLVLTCTLHPWEKAFVMVLDPTAASITTRDDGRFLLFLRPGSYRVKAWQERYGTLETTVDVAKGPGVPVDFTFDAGAADLVRSR